MYFTAADKEHVRFGVRLDFCARAFFYVRVNAHALRTIYVARSGKAGI